MMTKTERRELLELARARAKLAEAEVDSRTAAQEANFEAHLATRFHWASDSVWKQAREAAQDAISQADEITQRRSQELSIPSPFAPSIANPYWTGRGKNMIRERRTELTKVAHSRFDVENAEGEARRRSLAGDSADRAGRRRQRNRRGQGFSRSHAQHQPPAAGIERRRSGRAAAAFEADLVGSEDKEVNLKILDVPIEKIHTRDRHRRRVASTPISHIKKPKRLPMRFCIDSC
jgi:hypothetical protein